MVITQAHRIYLALTAFAVLAGPSLGTAGALPGDDGEIDLAVDGSFHSRIDQQVVAPVALPIPAQNVGHEADLRVRTYDLVVPSPVGPSYRFASGTAPGVGPRPLHVDGEGVSADAVDHSYSVPWYYMMDDASVRPYRALFWDTGTSWYLSLGEDVYGTYVGMAPVPAPDPTPPLAAVVPDVWVRTAVEEIGLAASLQVLLHNALDTAAPASFERPDAPLPARAGPAMHALDAALAPADGAMVLRSPTGAATVPAPAAAEAPRSGLAAGAAPTRAFATLEAAAAGAALVGAVALYHLIRKSAILKNKVRGSIAEHVLRHPGSTITEIAQAVGVTHQTASYHLRLLQEHGLVLGVERGNKRLYFRNDGSFNNEERGLVAVLRDPESMRVLELIRANPWIMKNEAAAALGVSRNTLNWHLQKLLAAGLVSEARENGHCFLFCNRHASGELLSSVVQKVEERRGAEPAPPANGNGASPVPAPGGASGTPEGLAPSAGSPRDPLPGA